MMKRLFPVILAILTISTLVFSSCANSTPTPPPSSAPAPATTSAPASKPATSTTAPSTTAASSTAPASAPKAIELRFAHHEAAVTGAHKLYTEWAGKVKEQTNGKVNITIYPAASLSSISQMWASITGGVTDIGTVMLNEDSAHLVLNTIVKLQTAQVPEGIKGMQIWQELTNKFPDMAAEYGSMKLLFAYTTSPSALHTMKKEVHVPKDLQGMKIMAASKIDLDWMKLCGASPISMSSTDWYTSLERGLSEGLISPYQAMDIFGTTPLMKYHVEPAYGPNIIFILMNKDKWNSLTPDVQKVFDDLKPWAIDAFCQLKVGEGGNVKQKCKAAGQSFYTLSPEEHKLWNDTAATITDQWIKQVEGLGKPGKAMHDEILKISDKYAK